MLTSKELAAQGVVMTPLFVGDGCSILYQVPAGKRIGQHAHKVGHISVLLQGTALVRRGGVTIEQFVAPATVFIPAEVEHEIEGVTDILWSCNWTDAQGLIDAEEFGRAVAA